MSEEKKVQKILDRLLEEIEKTAKDSCFVLSCYKGKNAKMNAVMCINDKVRAVDFKNVMRMDMVDFWENLK